jgi:type II secretory pathway pseudopilin PulG
MGVESLVAHRSDFTQAASHNGTGYRPMKQLSHRAGFTLIELFAVFIIIAVLISLLLPAIQNAREAARKASCSNNLSLAAIATLQHEQTFKFFPSGGWGWDWVGDPDRGSGKEQPGSWIYAILPFMEQTNLHDLGKDGDPDNWTPSQIAAGTQCIQTPLPTMNCPTRRWGGLFGIAGSAGGTPGAMIGPGGGISFHGTNAVSRLARTDYAACAGDQQRSCFIAGPNDLGAARRMTDSDTWPSIEKAATGISYFRSEVTMAVITDGTSKTYMIGEKYLNPDNYMDGNDGGDNESMYNGYDNDNHRTTYFDGVNPDHTPVQDTAGKYPASDRFGSAHAISLNMAFCDGAVRAVNYTIDAETHRRLGNRKDGKMVDGTQL